MRDAKIAQFTAEGNRRVVSSSSDSRLDELRQWVSARLGVRDVALERASEDASFRRYFRVRVDGRIVDRDGRAARARGLHAVRATSRSCMRDAGVHVPEVLAQDLARGFLLLSDLGTTTYLKALDERQRRRAFRRRDRRARQVAAREPARTCCRRTTKRCCRRELELFPSGISGATSGVTLDAGAARVARRAFSRASSTASLAQPKVYVHRDYMPRNLMLSEPNPGVLDFQDAVYGPITYDVVSLFRDAFVSWPEERVLDWTVRYWERAKQRGLAGARAISATFYRDFEWMGLQRHLKVLGIFARIHYRDGKPGYLDDTPRFLGYARAVAARYAELARARAAARRSKQRSAARGLHLLSLR